MLGNWLRFKRVVALALASVSLSCTAVNDVVEPSLDPSLSSGGRRDNLNLLQCDPLPSQRTVKTIGSAGGTITVGRHSLVIPAGALRSSTRITAEAISDGANSVRFSPEGLHFARSTRLFLDYSNCPLSRTLPLLRKVAYTDEQLNIKYLQPSLDYPRQQTVEGDVDHFSRYAVAW